MAPDFDLWVPLPPGSSAGFEANLLGHFDALLDRFEAGNDLSHVPAPLDRGEVAVLLGHLLDQLKWGTSSLSRFRKCIREKRMDGEDKIAIFPRPSQSEWEKETGTNGIGSRSHPCQFVAVPSSRESRQKELRSGEEKNGRKIRFEAIFAIFCSLLGRFSYVNYNQSFDPPSVKPGKAGPTNGQKSKVKGSFSRDMYSLTVLTLSRQTRSFSGQSPIFPHARRATCLHCVFGVTFRRLTFATEQTCLGTSRHSF